MPNVHVWNNSQNSAQDTIKISRIKVLEVSKTNGLATPSEKRESDVALLDFLIFLWRSLSLGAA